ncbi:uncharacterized protein si:ch211-79k12.1 [Electrophorus electricus]|uniref:Ig-like domain-containing protein n=1 Tax=Electrophorus electricus TaxID=8005 RepID=A0A4W4GLD8_ELEEL|nr:uncharacterized protein si:ch211-79k12.1 [Electrophorus electricus]
MCAFDVQALALETLRMRARVLFVTALLAFLQYGTASLIVKGPTEPVLEGGEATLECVDTESKFNISTLQFEKFSKHMQRWYRLDMDQYSYLYRRCFFYGVEFTRENGRLLLKLPRVQTWMAGPFRCISDNATDPDNSSLPFTIPVHYMRELSVYRSGVGTLSRYYSLQDLRVSLGDNVELNCCTSASETPEYFWAKEGEDWIVPSSTLRLEQVRDMNSGKYTCTAQHPTVRSLVKTHTISITVLPEDAAWYESTTARITLMTSAAGVALFVVILSITVFLCRRAKQRTSKGPIDDHSQKKPIYKNSVESLPSTTGDKDPLV